ncbi:MAG: hypothetical protein KIT84_26925 [Labilithrix sp.]|nr:hypothetical protein [Labilithrix sp.]MCW5814689.1 hypothetical protein [Labilithrix sp.]
MSSKKPTVSGARTLVAGTLGAVVLFELGLWLDGGPGVGLCFGSVVLGGMSVVKGIGDIVRARARRALPGRAPRALPPRDDPRWSDAPSAPQVAGKRCSTCDDRITVASEGAACDECDAPLHIRCLAKHASTHGPSAGPFRGA